MSAEIRGWRAGFTIVELLVVVAILIVLAALTLVVTSRVRQSALQATALDSFHHAATANVSFAMANNGHLYTWNNWENVNRVSSVAEVIHVGYGFGVFDENDGREYVDRPTDGKKPPNNICYLPSKKAMLSFLDGHVETLAPPIPERMFREVER